MKSGRNLRQRRILEGENRLAIHGAADFHELAARFVLSDVRHEFETKPYDLEILKIFASGLGPGARVCDVGCGPCAHVTRLLADQGLKLTGVDISPRCIALAQREQPSLHFAVMDMAHPDRREAGAADGLARGIGGSLRFD